MDTTVTDGKAHVEPLPAEFYASVLTNAERERLSAAREIEGLGEEIAVLRVKLLSPSLSTRKICGC